MFFVKTTKKADVAYIKYVEVIGLSGGSGIAAGELHSRFVIIA